MERKVGETKRVKRQKSTKGNCSHQDVVIHNERVMLFLQDRLRLEEEHARHNIYCCSNCGQPGHNRRSCPLHNVKAEDSDDETCNIPYEHNV